VDWYVQREETEDQTSPCAEVMDEAAAGAPESPAISTENVVEQQLSDVEDRPDETQSRQSLPDDEGEQSPSPPESRQSSPSQASVQDEPSDHEVGMY